MAIAGIFLLVPAFLLIPLIGKLVDFKATSLEAARYAAFERTVTSDSASVRGATFAQLSNADLQNGTLMRFFSANSTTVAATQNSSTSAFAPRHLWVDQSLTAFMPNASNGSLSISQSTSPAHADQTLGTILQVLNDLSVGFDWNADGYYTASVSATARLPANVGSWGGKALTLPYDANPLTFTSSDTLLTDSNSASGPDYVKSQVSKAVPTSLASFVSGALSAIAVVVPDLSGLTPGYVLVNSAKEVPCDRLSGGCAGGSSGGTGTGTVSQSTINSVETQMKSQGYQVQSQTNNADGSVTLTFSQGTSTVPVTLEPSGGTGGGGSTTTQQSTQDVYNTALSYYNSLTSATQGWSGGPAPLATTDLNVTSWQMTFTKTFGSSTSTMTVTIQASSSTTSTVTITTS